LQIYNSQGKLSHTLESSGVEILDPCITNNGRYLGYHFGTETSDEGEYWSKIGYRIIDLKQNKIIDHQEVKEVYGWTSMGNIIIMSSRKDSLDYSHYYLDCFDFENNRKYNIIIAKDSISNINEATPKGIQIEYKDNSIKKTRFLYFEQNFKSEDIIE
jgi:hypothetical protein